MELPGEAFFLLNAWMNFLSITLAGGFLRRRAPLIRSAAASLILAVATLILMNGSAYPAPLFWIVPGAFLMAVLAFGMRNWRAGGWVLISGLLLSGLSDFLLNRGCGGRDVGALSGMAALAMAYASRRLVPSGRGNFMLCIGWQGKEISVPAFRDSGNRLWDSVSVLPVIVAPAHWMMKLLPSGVNPKDLSTMPPGFRILRMETVAGVRAAMCFQPDRLFLRRGKKEWEMEALIAVSDFSGPWALLPEALFQQKEEENYAGL